MKLLVELSQLVIALVISSVVALLVGPTYLAVAVLVLGSCLVLLFDAARLQSIVTEIPVSLGAGFQIIGTAVVFGMIWPAIPLIFIWKRDVVDE